MARRKNGQGWFEKIEDGKIRMRMQIGYRSNGSPRIITVTGTSETDCMKKMRKRENTIKDHMSSGFAKGLTVAELCQKHLEEHLGEKERLKPKSADRRESTIRNQISPYAIGKKRVTSVTSLDIKNHIEGLLKEGKISVSSVEKTLDVINAAYKWANSQNHLGFNPCTAVLESLKNRLKNLETKNSSDGVVIILSDAQVSKLKKDVEELLDSCCGYICNWALTILLLLYTGMRIGESCCLRWHDWNPKTRTLNIIKTRNIAVNRKSKGKGDTYIPNENEVKNCHSRTIELTEDANDVLAKIYELSPLKSQDDYIVYNRRLKPTNPSNFGKNINKMYKRLGFPEEITGAHILRRTCATQMYNDGSRIEDIAAYLGDTPETIRKHYISMTKRLVADGVILNVVKVPGKNK